MPAPATRERAFLLGVYHSCCYFSPALASVALYCKNKAMKAVKNIRKSLLNLAGILCFILLNQLTVAANVNYDKAPIGITLNGAEFGQHNLPGIYKKDYIFPNEQEIKYFAGKGVELIQLPVRWERAQQKIGAALDQQYMNLINNFIATCKNYRVSVIVTIQNYGRYHINNVPYLIGSKEVPYTQYRAFWKNFDFYLCTKFLLQRNFESKFYFIILKFKQMKKYLFYSLLVIFIGFFIASCKDNVADITLPNTEIAASAYWSQTVL